MKRKTGLWLLVVVATLVSLSHLELERADDRWLVRIDGRPADPAGWLSDGFNRLRRDCRAVQPVATDDPRHRLALRVLQAHSPPDSLSVAIDGLWAQGDWMMAVLRFERLQPAVALLHQTGAGWQVAHGGVWSGGTHPWRPGPFVRRYLARQVPDVPASLLACHELWPS